jgi:hypothetical protein
MKTSSHVSLTGPRGERGWGMLPHSRPRLPVEGEIFPVYIPVGEEISPSPSPNRGIPQGKSGIGSHYHLYTCQTQKVRVCARAQPRGSRSPGTT